MSDVISEQIKLLGIPSTKEENNLSEVYELNLSECCNVTDVSMLGKLHTLYLSECCNITDVSMLGNLHTLDLRSCRKIKDVSALGLVNKLNLYDCIKIKDIGCLRKTKILSITKKVYGLHLLRELEKLNISRKCKKQMMGEINKLKKINKKVVINIF